MNGGGGTTTPFVNSSRNYYILLRVFELPLKLAPWSLELIIFDLKCD